MSNLTVENVYTRHQTKVLAKKHFWKLLGMMLIVVVIVYGIYGAGLLLISQLPGAVATTELTATSASYNVNGSGAPYTLAMLALMLIVMLASGGLGLGLTGAMLDICRGDENVTVGRVFSRMGQCLKALGLTLWVGLKTMLWALPGYTVLLAAMVIPAMLAAAGPEDVAGVAVVLMLAGLVLLFALVIPAVYRYLLATYILADKPETGIRACVSESKALMKGHKWQAFKLVVPTVLILYGLMLLLVLLFALLTALLAEISEAAVAVLSIVLIVALLVLVLYYAVRMGLGYCIFYLNRQNKGAAEAPADEAPAE